MGEPVSGDLRRWMRDIVLQNQVVVGTVNAGPSAYKQAVILLERFMGLFPEAVRALIRRGPLDEAPKVTQKAQGIKDVISFI